MNLIHYVKQYGKSSFSEMTFNDIDNVIFSQLSYLPLAGIVGGFHEEAITIEEVAKILIRHEKKNQLNIKSYFCKKIYRLIKEMAKAPRYQHLSLSNYVQVINHDCQFGALSIQLPDHTIYVSYEGTDTTISGWREDACMTYQYPVPAQVLASQYLRKIYRFFGDKIRVGGHSKGGNIAVASVLESPFYVQRKVIAIYNNDGPGFAESIIHSRKYKRIQSKIHKIVPRESIIGMFLYYGEDISVVKSSSKRIFQHDPFHWCIEGNAFKEAQLSEYSKKVSSKTNAWLDNIKKRDCQKCMEDLFQVFDYVEVYDTHDFFSIGKSVKVVQNVKSLDEDSRKNLWDAIKTLV